MKTGNIFLWILAGFLFFSCSQHDNPDTLPKQYTLYFAGESVDIEPQSITHGNYAKAPVNPEREGYDFSGWFTDNGKNWDFKTDIVTQDTTLYAKWNEEPEENYQDVINLSKYTENKFDRYVSTNQDTIEINVKLAQIELWSNNEGKLGSFFGQYFEESINYIELTSEGLVSYNDSCSGKPSIPYFWHFMYYPLKFVNVSYKVLGYDEEIIDLTALGVNKKIYPFQKYPCKSCPPPDKFYIDTSVYSEDKYYNEEVAVFTEQGTDLLFMKQRMGGIIIRPIQYNPVQNKLRILNNLTFQVVFSIPSNIIDSIKVMPKNISVSDPVLFATYAKPYILEGGRTYQLNIDSIKEKKIYISGKFDSSNRDSPWIIRNSTVNIGLLPAGTYEVIYKFIDINPNGYMFPMETYSINFVVSENSKVQDVEIQ